MVAIFILTKRDYLLFSTQRAIIFVLRGKMGLTQFSLSTDFFGEVSMSQFFTSQRLHNSALIMSLILICFILCNVFLPPRYAFSAQVTLSWDPPTTYTDGTPLTDLSGYKVYYGAASSNYSQTINVGNTNTYTVTNLSDGTFYFAVTAYDVSGNESAYSNEVSKTIQSIVQDTLTVNITGNGTVTGTGINCGPVCTAAYNQGTVITLSAAPGSGSSFSGWSGGGCSGTGQCIFTMNTNTTVTATFAANTYTISASAGDGGSISPSGSVSVNQGASQTFTITPYTGYSISDVMIDGTSVGAVTAYTFSDVSDTHTINASFSSSYWYWWWWVEYTITASAGTGGSISPSGPVSINRHRSQTFTITPNSGYSISDVTIDGASVGAVTAYTFSDVTDTHTINASFSSTSNISFVQVAAATPQSSQTVAVSYPNSQTAGNLNIIVVGWNDTTAAVQSVEDSSGNVYNLAIGPTDGMDLSQSIYYANNIVGGYTTVTVTFSKVAYYPDIRILEYSGVGTLDKTAGASGNGSTANSGAVTTTAEEELIFSANTVYAMTSGADTSFTSRIITQDGGIAEDSIVSTTGSYSAAAPLTSAGPWVMQIATFK
jgi:hypothetical protein